MPRKKDSALTAALKSLFPALKPEGVTDRQLLADIALTLRRMETALLHRSAAEADRAPKWPKSVPLPMPFQPVDPKWPRELGPTDWPPGRPTITD